MQNDAPLHRWYSRDFACFSRPFAFITPANQERDRHSYAALTLPVCPPEAACVLLVGDGPGLARLASLLLSTYIGLTFSGMEAVTEGEVATIRGKRRSLARLRRR